MDKMSIQSEVADGEELLYIITYGIYAWNKAGRPIVFMDETYVNSSYTVPNHWQMDDTGLHIPLFGKGERLIILNAASEKEFIPNESLVYKASSSSGDHHSDMNGANFVQWLKEKLIPNLEINTGSCR